LVKHFECAVTVGVKPLFVGCYCW